MRPRLVATVAGVVWNAVPDAVVAHDNAMVSVTLPRGSTVEQLEAVRGKIAACSSYGASLGEQCGNVIGDVRGVHFGDVVMTVLARATPVAH